MLHLARGGLRPRLVAGTALAMLALATSGRDAMAGPYPMPTPELDAVDIAGFYLPRVTSFGDSFSRVNRSVRDPATGRYRRVLNWLEQSNRDGFTGAPAPYAVSGASAANIPIYNGQVNSFAQQVQRWSSNGRPLGPREATAVYFGNNDIKATDKLPTIASMQRSKNDYGAAVKRLISFGTTSGDRHTFLFLTHDWGRNPASNGDPGLVLRQRSQNWNNYIKYFAKGRSNVVTVDLQTTFNRVYANPGAFGLDNVRTVDLDRSATTALYADPEHFGEKGQDIIEQVFLHYAARAYGYGTAASLGTRIADRVAGDVDRGIALGVAAQPERERLGLTAFTVGEVRELRPAAEDVIAGDPSRAGFAAAFHPDERPDGGLGVSYVLSPDRSLGVVIGRYDDAVRTDLERGSERASAVTDAVSVYLDQGLRGLAWRTRLTVADHSTDRLEHDALIDATSRSRFAGRTTEIAQRLGYPVEGEAAVVTPWLELTHRRQENDGFTVSNPYLSDVSYSATEAGETLAGVGLDARSRPIRLGKGASLFLHGGLAYTQSLARDDYRLRISEAAGVGADQVETIERDQLRQVTLDLGGQVELGQRLSLGAGLAWNEDLDLGREQAVTVRVGYRF